MKNSTIDRVKGKAQEIKGKTKEKVGRAINDPNMEAEGTAEKAAGKVGRKVGEVKKVFGK